MTPELRMEADGYGDAASPFARRTNTSRYGGRGVNTSCVPVSVPPSPYRSPLLPGIEQNRVPALATAQLRDHHARLHPHLLRRAPLAMLPVVAHCWSSRSSSSYLWRSPTSHFGRVSLRLTHHTETMNAPVYSMRQKPKVRIRFRRELETEVSGRYLENS
jgi:hypothetical protein